MALPPLVEPVVALPESERLRRARQSRLPEIGDVGQRRLFAARVAVLGAGGIGSPVLLYLAAAGFGTIAIIDDDIVEESNLQRQVIFAAADIGRRKSTVAATRVRALAPSADVIEHTVRLTAANARDLLADYDLVIDGSDSFTTRYAVADACDELGVPLVWGSVLRFDAQVSVFWSRPLAGEPVSLRDVFPEAPPAGTVPSCAEAGVLGALCGQVGALLVAEATKLVCGIGQPLLGRLLVIDALTARTREIRLAPSAAERARVVLPEELSAAQGPGALLLDVREHLETVRGTIPGAVTIPLAEVLAAPEGIAADAAVIVYCQRGPRARSAARAIAAAHPDADVRVLAGGYEAWVKSMATAT
ncbi:ThiF family adenylyltransferase [Microbacterium flavum]|uniref:ThiF family adenylyltransferase n=1 Tax=Microbacterium flavum TaxID=415216 RepID=A0ABS5XW42_9MICO|nr:ThiF family adenylyltransferase [Microbacterium flavum]MBT8798762.1 ThiF family adenylyltransferase [Microbacterium flavum]